MIIDPRTRELKSHIQEIIDAGRQVLHEAIQAGGSSIDDFRHVNGLSGRFQQTLMVYGRTRCGTCGGAINRADIGGRSSFWCARCQR